jgi:uncharacterized protein (DUF697 family)
MHSTQIILALSLIATAAPALAAPLPAPGSKFNNAKFARAFEAELEARAPISFGPLGKELLKGLAGGAALSGIFGGISALTGQQKRDSFELEAREPVSFGPLGKELLKGLAGGAALSGIFGGISALTGGGQRRDLDERAVVEDIIKPVIASIFGGLASKGAKDGLGKVFGARQLTQEEADELERQLEALYKEQGLQRRQGVAGAVAKSGLGSLIGKAIVGGLGSAIGGFGVDKIFESFQSRELGDDWTQEEADGLEKELEALMANKSLSRRQGVAGAVAKSGLGSLIGKAIVGGLGSAIGGFGVDKIFQSFQGRDLGDNLTQEEADELERELEQLMANQPASKRDLEARINLGPLSKGLIGLGTSLGVGAIASNGLDALQGLFQREASLNELD